MYTLGALLLGAILLGIVTTVVDSVLGVVGLSALIKKLPIIGSNWTLIVSVLMMSVVKVDVIKAWGFSTGEQWGGWFGYIANGAVIMGMVPVKDAAVSMIGKGFRA
jgi:hypothetical protein